MNKRLFIKTAVLTLLLSFFFYGCDVNFSNSGGSSGSGSGSSGNLIDATGVIVDPYIVGAVLCEDKNKNGICDPGEQLSSSSNKLGQFKFDKDLTPGSRIIVKTQGTHNGLTYNLKLSAVVDDNKKVKVISPLTTLGADKALTKAQIVTLLGFAGINISEADVSADPMHGLGGKTSFTDADVKNLHASLTTYGLLRVVEGSNTLNTLGPALFMASQEIKDIAGAMGECVKDSLSKSRLDTIQAQVPNNPFIPPVTSDVIIRAAVTIMDKLTEIGYSTCNSTGGNANAAVTKVQEAANKITAQASNIGQYCYGLENKDTLKPYESMLPEYVKKGVNATSDVVIIDNEGNIQ